MTDRKTILETAIEYVTKDRNHTHGEPENSFGIIAGHWTWWLQNKLKPGAEITKHDVSQMMVGFKQSRAMVNPSNIDTAIDGAGYFAISGELGMTEASSISDAEDGVKRAVEEAQA